MPESRLSRQHVVAAALAVVVVAATAVVFTAVGHQGKRNGAKKAGVNTGPGPSSGSGAGSIAGLRASQVGVSTGVVLFSETVAKIDSDIAGIAADGAKMGPHRHPLGRRRTRPRRLRRLGEGRRDRRPGSGHTGSTSCSTSTGPRSGPGIPARGRPSSPRPPTYATYAAKVASRYKGKVQAYELGNEPNHVKWRAHPDAAQYAQVLPLFVYPVIKAADAEARVLTGGLGGNKDKNGNIPGDVFLADLYKAGAKGFFDAVSYHPYTYPLLQGAAGHKGDRGWSRMLAARQTMVDNGDGDKQIWVTEFGAPTGGRNAVSQAQQAAIMHDAYRLWAGYSWAGPLCWFDYRDKGNDTSDQGNSFGLYTSDGQPKLALAQFTSLVPPAN